jgi:hypothetical protein
MLNLEGLRVGLDLRGSDHYNHRIVDRD